MGSFVICAFRPKPGKADALLDVLRDHMPVLRGEGLITDRPAYVMRAADGTIIEIFEWKSKDAIARAHENPAVGALWRRFEAVCDYLAPAEVSDLGHPFPGFEPVDL